MANKKKGSAKSKANTLETAKFILEIVGAILGIAAAIKELLRK